MLKKIIAAFIGSMAAIWVSAGVFALFGVIILIMIIGASATGTSNSNDGILMINLSGTINDRAQSFSLHNFIYGDAENSQNLDEILEAIDYAADDSNIKGIFINCDDASLGYGCREELIAALNKFKKSSKWIYAYADNYNQADYYVASVATKVYLNPVGTVNIKGLGSSIPFYKNVLDKLGVQMQIVKVGTYKSAVEPYILTEASEPSKEQTRVYLDAIWNNITETISKNRGVSVNTLNTWADSLYMTVTGSAITDANLVYELKYRRQVEDKMRDLTDTDWDASLNYITPAEYLASNPKPKIKAQNEFDSTNHFAVLYAVGEIVDSGDKDIVGDKMVDQIRELALDEDVKGLVLRVNSPGGSAFASEQIWEALEFFKSRNKLLYVSMGDYAASGGYYISCGAHKIFADANTLTGSIGIFGMIPCLKGLLNDKIGVNFTNIQTHKGAAFPSVYEPMSEAERAAMQKSVDNGYDLFIQHVADGRGIPNETVRLYAEGRVWDGKSAKRLKLVDEIGSLNDAIAEMAHKLKTSKYNYVSYPIVEQSALEKIISKSGGLETAFTIEGLDAKDVKRGLSIINRATTAKGHMQARMEDVVLE